MLPLRQYRKSLAWYVGILYFFMNLASIAFFTYVIGSHQAELAVEVTRYQAMELLSGLMGDFATSDSAHAVAVVRNATVGTGHRYAFVRDFQVVEAASPDFSGLPADFRNHVLKAEMARDFSGRRFHLQVKPVEQEIDFYVPMKEFGRENTVLFLKMDMRDVGSRIKSMAKLVLLAVVVLSCVHLIFALLVLKWVVKPIRVLWTATEKVAQGDEGHRVGFSRDDEIGGLAAGFNRMLDVIREDKKALQHRMDLLQEANARIEKMAVTDALTGIFNRRYFMDRLQSEMALAAEQGHALSLLLLDVDFFKKINDSRGHVVGDLVLSRLGRTLLELLPESGVAARYGGEEFVVLLPHSDVQVAFAVAEVYRCAVAGLDFAEEGYADLTFSISLGVAEYKDVGTRFDRMPVPEEFLSAADAALYVSKESGRNRTTLHVAGKE